MTENNFIKQLKDLKKITPDSAWLKSNREILLSQISNSGVKELSVWKRILIDARSFTMTVSQPALVLGALLLFATGASAFGHLAFNRAKPDESLYIARIISEKAKLSTVFNNEEKAKLEVKFAADHAEAITEVLSRTEEGAHNEVKVAELNKNFDREINTVRARIAAIQKTAIAPEVSDSAVSEDGIIISAGTEKDGAGLQLSINNGTVTPTTTATSSATGTLEVKTEPVKDVKAANEILDEAKTLFDNKEYNGAMEKIKEVRELIK
ncbi:hypothetical protein CVU83_00030 [Candidatus Falkowbacteria bacterium HGW-Falkowbacteria-2]|uniref:DUF5667 domain-containing protein n=1 Tax=Candidatus Falkowbacteria bacterium HGW-Falkowbacteria-2 TaxID=2013769 RepID=A0A2N2E3S8_9BACT|nr:MAG: hypothetical protein CVU83_00030 [Candidatus Falkowbacteria bacterium HGW-Falkowbacteria-2]